MNYTFIILGIFLVIVLWVLYRTLMAPTSIVATQNYLQDNLKPVLLSSLSNSNSINYYYSLWIYVNNLNSPSPNSTDSPPFPQQLSSLNDRVLSNNIFFLVDKDNKPYLSLDVNNSTALKACILLQSDQTNLKQFDITPNFPFQRWEFVIISVNQSYIDFYLDGKLIKSANLGSNTQSPPVSGGSIKFGNGDMYIAGFQRVANAMDPQTAWNMYLTGSGTTKSPLNYGLSMTLSKNNTPQSTITVF